MDSARSNGSTTFYDFASKAITDEVNILNTSFLFNQIRLKLLFLGGFHSLPRKSASKWAGTPRSTFRKDQICDKKEVLHWRASTIISDRSVIRFNCFKISGGKKIFLLAPSFLSRLSGDQEDKINYWHQHVDQLTYENKDFQWSALIYLDDYGIDFDGNLN